MRPRDSVLLACVTQPALGRAKFTLGGGGLVTKSCPTLATPLTTAHQAPLSMELSTHEEWSG